MSPESNLGTDDRQAGSIPKEPAGMYDDDSPRPSESGNLFDRVNLDQLTSSLEKWRERVRDPWLEQHPERRDSFQTLSGLNIDSLYTPVDQQEYDYESDLGFPGQPPFTRGAYPTMYRGRLWTRRQIAGFGTAHDTNRRFKYLLKQGQTGLSTDFDHPTLTGYDSDDEHARGEVGRVGVAVDSLADFENLFEDIPLAEVSTSMTINSPAPVMLAFYVALADKRGVDRSKLRGTIQNSIFKEFISQKTYALPPRPNIEIVKDVIEFCTREVPNWYWVSVSGYHTREAGSNAIQEAAFTLAQGLAYLECGIERGLDPDDFAPRMSFFFIAQTDLFEEVAKFRVVRRMWARITKERYGVQSDEARRMRFHVQTSGESLTAKQPRVNIIRTTIQALAAVLGGAQSLHTCGYDEALAIPTEEAMRLALRTQQVVAYESGVADTIDPLGGSHYLEHLTNRMETEILEYLETIEEMGEGSMKEGMLRGIENGFYEKEIVNNSYDLEKRKASGELKKVGVNCFTEGGEEQDIELFEADPEVEERQLKRLNRVKETRDESEVQARLDRLREAEEGDENILPHLIEAAKAYATEGEMMGILRDLYGTYEDPGVY